MVTVLVADQPAQQAIAESALREAGIAFVTKNDATQHLLGAGQIGGLNLVAGQPTIQVSTRDAHRATQLIHDAISVADPDDTPAASELEDTDPFSAREVGAIRHARYSAVWAILYLWGIGSLLAVYFGGRALTSYSLLPTRSKVLAIFGVASGGLGIVATAAGYFW